MRAALVLAVLAACVSTPTTPDTTAHDGWVDVCVQFEPALTGPGLLVVEHEAGVRLQLPTRRTGVDLRLPPGPASLRLVVGDRAWEQPIRVQGGSNGSCNVTFSRRPVDHTGR